MCFWMGIGTTLVDLKGKELSELPSVADNSKNNSNTHSNSVASTTKNNNSKKNRRRQKKMLPVQKLYDTCKDVFAFGGPGIVPSPEKIERLRSVLGMYMLFIYWFICYFFSACFLGVTLLEYESSIEMWRWCAQNWLKFLFLRDAFMNSGSKSCINSNVLWDCVWADIISWFFSSVYCLFDIDIIRFFYGWSLFFFILLCFIPYYTVHAFLFSGCIHANWCTLLYFEI